MVRFVGKGSWRVAVASGGLLVLGGCGVALTVLSFAGGLQVASAIAGVMGVVLGLPALASALRSWSRQGTEATAAQVAQARESLAGWVCDQWRDEALARSLGHPQPMPVHWRLTEHSVMARSRRNVAGVGSFTGRSDDISVLATKFRGLPCRRLVLLGGPGSGKTTLAVQLLLELLATRQPGEPIPVLVSLAGWDPATDRQLHGWLAARLAENYPSLLGLGPDVARALVEQGHILPILDGFDEVPGVRQAEMLIALNASLTDADQLVLTSRTQEYQAAVAGARTVLTAATVIESEPLTPDQAVEYLQACLPPDPDPAWCEVLDRLRAGTAPHLAAVLATPLGLWLLRIVYLVGGANPALLLTSAFARNPARLQDHLFDQLISAVLTAYPASRNHPEAFRPRHTWEATKVNDWLTYLARYLSHIGTRDLLWWQLARHTLTRRTFGLIAGLVVGMATGVGTGLAIGVMGSPRDGLVYGLGFGLWAGLVIGLGIGLAARVYGLRDRLKSHASEPGTVAVQVQHHTGRPVRDLGIGLLFGLGAGLVFGVGTGLVIGVSVGLVIGLGTGLGAVLEHGLGAALEHGLGAALKDGLAAGVTPGLHSGLDIGLQAGLWFGLAGLIYGLRAGLGNQDWFTSDPTYANLQLRHRAGTLIRDLAAGLGAGLGTGLGAGLLFGLVAELVNELIEGLVDLGTVKDWLVNGLWFGLVAGLVFGLLKWVGIPSRTGWASTPRSTYQATRALTVIQISVGILAVGLVFGLVGRQLHAPWVGTEATPIALDSVLVYGLGPGLAAGLGLMSSGAWFSYLLTSWRLAAAGKLPLRLMGFLDDAHRLGLLRTTGPAYQFRHAEFHDYLVRAHPSGESASDGSCTKIILS